MQASEANRKNSKKLTNILDRPLYLLQKLPAATTKEEKNVLIVKVENNTYKVISDGNVWLTVELLGNNIYRAINSKIDITAEVKPINEYETSVICVEHKFADKNGRYRKNTKLLNHSMLWLVHTLEELGIIRKPKCRN